MKIRTVILLCLGLWYVTPTIDQQLPYCDLSIYRFAHNGGINCHGAQWFTHDEGGFYNTYITFRPFHIHRDYLSNEWTAVLNDARSNSGYCADPTGEWNKSQRWIRDRDEQKTFDWPRW